MFWLLTVAGVIVQILCCVYGKNKLQRLLPIGLMLVIMAATLVFGSMFGSLGFAGALVLVWNELKILAALAVTYGLCALVFFAKK